jgi:hypothetical protein
MPEIAGFHAVNEGTLFGTLVFAAAFRITRHSYSGLSAVSSADY